MATVNFSIDGLDNLFNNDWRWNFREEPAKWFQNLKDSLVGISDNYVHAFYKGQYDAAVEDGEIVFIKGEKDLSEEIIVWLERQYIESGEAVESYFEGMTKSETLVNRTDFTYSDDYDEEVDETRKLYRNYYDRESAKLRQLTSAWNWFNKNWFGGVRTLPQFRSFKEIRKDIKIEDYRCTDFTKVDDHALILDVDGNVWWYGEDTSYSALQHLNLHSELRKLGLNVGYDYSQDNICYDPHNKWRFAISNATPAQIATLVKFALDRNKRYVSVGDYDYTVESMVALAAGEIDWFALEEYQFDEL